MKSPFDLKIKSIGGTDLGYMLSRDSNGRRSYQVRDAQTIAARFLSTEQLTQAQLPPDLESIFFQDNWRSGIGGLRDRKHPRFLANSTKIDISEEGVIKLARNTVANTVDSNPDEYVPSGFVVSATQLWAFIGRDVYSWDFTNKNWDIQTEPVGAARLYRNGVPFAGTLYVPGWSDDAGSGGSFVAADEPVSYLYKTPSAAQWSVITTSGQTLDGCKHMAVANQVLWGGYWASAADSTLNVDGPAFGAVSSVGSTSAETSVTLSHTTPVGNNRLLIVTVVGNRVGDGEAPSGVTYNAVAMTNVAAASVVNGDMDISIWYLVAPAEGSNDIVVTWPNIHNQHAIGGTSFNGVDQSTPIENGNTATGSSTSPSVAVTTDVRDWAVDVLGYVSTSSATVDSSQTQRWQEASSSIMSGATSTEEATGSSTTMSWTTPNVAWAMGGVALNPATVQAGDTVIPVSGTPSAQFAAGDVIKVETELMLVTAVDDAAFTITVVRAYRGSVVATHAADTDIYEITEDVHHVRSTPDGTSMANWSTPTVIGDSSSPITAIVGAGNDLVVIKTDGVNRLEADGTVTPLQPNIAQFAHDDFGKGAWGWNELIFIPLHGGGLWELETRTFTIRDISFEHVMPELTEFHGPVIAGSGEPGKLYVLVHEPANTQYHILMTENPNQTGLGDYNWSHIGSVSYTTGTDVNHAALLLEAITSGSAEHHRLLIGIESTGSNLLSSFITHDSHDDDDAFTDDSDAYAYTTIYDAGFPNVDKRFKDITLTTKNLGGTAGTNHQIEVQYRIEGGSWTYITGSQATSTLTQDVQTLTFAAGITGKTIELRTLLTRKTSDDGTSPEVDDFTLTCQLRTESLKLLPLHFYLANGMKLRDGRIENQAKTKRDQLRTWNAQAAEVVVADTEGGTRNCVFLPGQLREQELRDGFSQFPEYDVSVVLAEVG